MTRQELEMLAKNSGYKLISNFEIESVWKYQKYLLESVKLVIRNNGFWIARNQDSLHPFDFDKDFIQLYEFKYPY